MISDESYEKLVAIKGNMSFTELIYKIVEAVKSKKNSRIMQFAGILAKEEAAETEAIVRAIRKKAGVRQ